MGGGWLAEWERQQEEREEEAMRILRGYDEDGNGDGNGDGQSEIMTL